MATIWWCRGDGQWRALGKVFAGYTFSRGWTPTPWPLASPAVGQQIARLTRFLAGFAMASALWVDAMCVLGRPRRIGLCSKVAAHGRYRR